MTTRNVLALAVLALAPAETVLGEIVAPAPELPWRSLTVSMPGNATRSEASPAQAYTVRVRVLVSAATDLAAGAAADATVAALEGAVPDAEGWACGPLLARGMSDPYPNDVVIARVNKHLVSVPLAFEFTASRLPA